MLFLHFYEKVWDFGTSTLDTIIFVMLGDSLLLQMLFIQFPSRPPIGWWVGNAWLGFCKCRTAHTRSGCVHRTPDGSYVGLMPTPGACAHASGCCPPLGLMRISGPDAPPLSSHSFFLLSCLFVCLGFHSYFYTSNSVFVCLFFVVCCLIFF